MSAILTLPASFVLMLVICFAGFLALGNIAVCFLCLPKLTTSNFAVGAILTHSIFIFLWLSLAIGGCFLLSWFFGISPTMTCIGGGFGCLIGLVFSKSIPPMIANARKSL